MITGVNIKNNDSDKEFNESVISDIKIGDCHWITLEDGLSCLVQDKNVMCSPLTDKKYISHFFTNGYNDICIELKDEDNCSFFYHYKKIFDKYVNVFSTCTDNHHYKMLDSKKEGYWLLENVRGDQAIYYPKQASQITPFFSKIVFDTNNSNYHLAHFSKSIVLDSGKLKSQLIGYVGYDGCFSSRIFDVEEQKYYTISGNGINAMNSFTGLVKNLKMHYSDIDDYIFDLSNVVLANLYSEHIETVQPKKTSKCKIIDFNSRK